MQEFSAEHKAVATRMAEDAAELASNPLANDFVKANVERVKAAVEATVHAIRTRVNEASGVRAAPAPAVRIFLLVAGALSSLLPPTLPPSTRRRWRLHLMPRAHLAATAHPTYPPLCSPRPRPATQKTMVTCAP
jgi:hypothetical protein